MFQRLRDDRPLRHGLLMLLGAFGVLMLISWLIYTALPPFARTPRAVRAEGRLLATTEGEQLSLDLQHLTHQVTVLSLHLVAIRTELGDLGTHLKQALPVEKH